MNLKKILMLAVVAIAAALSAKGDELLLNARNLRSQAVTYLSQKGYSPTINSEGDIRFVYDGNTYFIQFIDIGKYVVTRYQIAVTIPPNVSRARAEAVCKFITQQKLCGRGWIYQSGRTINVHIDTFCSGIQMFKDVFLSNMKLLDILSDSAIEELNKR